MNVKMELSRILIRETSDRHVIELREIDGERLLPIEIGQYEAAAIERRLRGEKPPRPQTHELLDNVITAMGGRLERIVIGEFRENKYGLGIFYARLYLKTPTGVIDIDCRPSDAIALGVASQAEIFVAERVLEVVCPTE